MWKWKQKTSLSRVFHCHGSFYRKYSSWLLIRIFFSFYFYYTDKKPTANDIFVYTVNKQDNRLKVIKLSIAELWSQSYKIRINNINDKHKKANADKEIKSQVTYAMKHKTVFHNSLHFVG